ncbi:hypothetical protein [Pseudodesulfovibrio piezophilus]|uniref:Nickel transport protein n=1 Tax=Pseudodesulfovibrio piezophilus (strain DSM 21447 / JCM 15486 / C1TLV30) TaxID=1322246 RepID=M1WM14_PSEP2|nr:hypothetical protein [Pseudodesulfovibrio piezophilus]CCH48815.1 conserved exported protein of unknown function [Pseudodesulfovibrio piezophilus C1TLV30]
MRQLIIVVCIAMAATLCMAAVSSAHKVNLFAYVDGDSIATDSGYSRSKRVHNGSIEVYDAASGKQLLTGRTDDNGKFDFKIPEEARAKRMDLRLVLKAGSGHQAEWVIHYAEYGAGPVPFIPEEIGMDAQIPASVTPVAGTLDTAAVEAIVRRELGPVKQMLAEMHDSGPGMTEILGGIGYIIGLFGIVAYMKSKQSN